MRRQDALSCKPTPMWRKALAWITSLAMVLMFTPAVALPASAWADDGSSGKAPVTYLDANGIEQTCTDYVEVTSNDTEWGTANQNSWYVAYGDITINQRVSANGDVHLILADNCKLIINGGINVNGNSSNLTIYASSSGENTLGRLIATGSPFNAGIGSAPKGYSGTIVINGGTIEATGGRSGSGIGCGFSGKCGRITINNGFVNATSGWFAAAIGNGNDGTLDSIVVNGGNITAISKTQSGSRQGPGIGASSGTCGDITICNAIVNAQGGNADGIGRKDRTLGQLGNVAISSNAVVFANSIAQTDRAAWNGIVFKNGSGKIYGGFVAPSQSFTIDSGKTLTIDSNQTLTIPNGVTLTNNGTITNSGTIRIMQGGSLNGTVSGTNNHYLELTSGTGIIAPADGEAITYGPLSKTYTVENNYYFPENYTSSVNQGNGITVTRESYTQVTVSGKPTANVTIKLPDAIKKTQRPKPSGITSTPSTAANDGELHGTSNEMEYRMVGSGGEWQDCSSDKVIGLPSGEYEIRNKETETALASDSYNVSVAKAPIQSTTFTLGKSDITYGETVTLEASATTLNSAAATYQWYDNDQLLTGETNSKFTSSALSAGEHVIRCEISCDGYTVKHEAEVTVNAKALTESMITGLVNSTPYTGSDITFAITVTDNGTALVEDTDYTVTYENNHNVGSAKVTIEGIGNYSGTVEKTFDITKATLSVSGTPSASATYGTPLKDIEVTGLTVKNTATDEPVDGTWKFQGDELLPAGNAEERTATFYPSDGNGNYAFLVSMQVTPTIAKAPGSVTAPKAVDGLVYNGTERALVTAASSDTGTVFYSLDGQNYSTNIPVGTKAGAYTVYYKVEGDGNHKDVAAQSISVKIAKAPVTITVKSKTIYVGEKVPSLDNPALGVDYEVEGLIGTDTLITAPKLAYVDNNGKPITPDTSKADGNAARIQASGADAGDNYDIGSCSDGTLIVKSSPYTPPTVSPSPDPKPDPTPEPTPAAPSVGNVVSPGEAGASATFTVTAAADESGNGGELQFTSPAPNAGASVVIPETVTINGVTYTVTSIADGAFAGMGQLESVSIPQTVTSIGAGAFKGCKRLSSIEIPGSVASIGAGAFQGSGLTSIALPASVKSIASDTFKDCKSLKQASSSATAIGKNAFYGCTALKSATLPKATSIGAGAFKGCKALKSVALGSGLKSIDKGAFAGCKSLRSITVTSKKLTKKGVTGSLEGSSVAKVTVQVGSVKQNKSYAKKYAKYFTKKICGKKGVKVTASKKPLKK